MPQGHAAVRSQHRVLTGGSRKGWGWGRRPVSPGTQARAGPRGRGDGAAARPTAQGPTARTGEAEAARAADAADGRSSAHGSVCEGRGKRLDPEKALIGRHRESELARGDGDPRKCEFRELRGATTVGHHGDEVTRTTHS